MSEKFQFRISSALKSVIGKDLITDDFVAIFELVKNSFDASSKDVTIRFDLENDIKDSKIFIIDDGKGMDKQDIIDKWLFVAFSAKQEGTEDATKKTYAGNKGVGRFSCDRLGSQLKLKSKTKEEEIVHCLDVNWDDFEENSTEEFKNIDLNYETKNEYKIPKFQNKYEHGVVLEISGLRNISSWSRKKLIALKRSLEKLVDPVEDIKNKKKLKLLCERENENDKDEKYKAEQKDAEAITVNGIIKNSIFDILINKTTVLKAQITPEKKLEVELVDRGVFIYKTEEDITSDFPNLINSEFYAEISFLNRSAKNIFSRRMGIQPVRYGSIFLIRNGFRVFPIGEDGNDYWGLDRRKQQGFARYLGSRDLLGFVKISGGEGKFLESSSRNQGLIQTDAAIELSALVVKCIRKFESYVVDITWKDKLDKENSEFERMGFDDSRYKIIQLVEKLSNSTTVKVLDFNHNLVSILNEKASDFEPSLKNLKNIAAKINDEKLSKQIELAEKALIKTKKAEYEALKAADHERKARKKAEESARVAIEEVEVVKEEKELVEEAYEEELKRNYFLTTSGSRDKDLLEEFMHQIVLYASQAKGKLQNLVQNPRKFKSQSEEQITNILSELVDMNQKIISTSRFATTANFRLESSHITDDINSFLKEFLQKMAPASFSKISINADNIDVKEFILTFNPIEIGMVLENFISNSKKSRATKISFSSIIKSNILILTIKDNGHGFDKKIIQKERIFEKGFTRTDGSGLGLYFAKNRIEELGGDVSISDTQPQRGVSFTVRIAKK